MRSPSFTARLFEESTVLNSGHRFSDEIVLGRRERRRLALHQDGGRAMVIESLLT